MNRIVLAALAILLLAAAGVFWFTGRDAVEAGTPPPDLASGDVEEPEALPSADLAGLEGPAPPEASELNREERRFGRYDRNRDGIITREELLSSRAKAFKKLDLDGNNLLTFEEWAVATSNRFKAGDKDGNGKLTPAEFAASAPKPAKKPACKCR